MGDHRALLLRWFDEVWNEGREAAIDELMDGDIIAHGLGDGGQALRGRAAFKTFYRAFRGAFPDIRCTVEDVVSEGDRAAWRLSARATHRGDQLGFPATGRLVRFTAMGFVRVRDGRIVEGWNILDLLGVLEQCGMAPRPRGGLRRA
jgi:steroid delta-isomerase-like uncharacterized protein